MNEAELVIGARQWLIPLAILFLIALGIVIWANLRVQRSTLGGILCGGLKLTAFAALVLCLLEPKYRGERPKPHANLVPILIDNSQSMQVAGIKGQASREQQVKEVLTPESAWHRRLMQDFDVRQYAFDSRLSSIADPADLAFDGSASSLRGAISTLHLRLRDRPVAGVLLFTDGNATDLNSDELVSANMPIYPVVPRNADDLQDLGWSNFTVSESDFEAAPVSVTAKIVGNVARKGKVVIRLLDHQNKVLEEQKLDAPTVAQPANVMFRFRPESSGVQFYRLSMFHEADQVGFEAGKSDLEATLANNTKQFVVHRRHGPYRILYLAGRPNWEFKFLRRALQEDPEVKMMGLLRIAKKEPKFSFRDRGGVGDTNSLFAGLGKDEEEAAEQYDEPVLIRLGVEHAEELRGGFPKTAAELFAYQTIILDDLESDFFSEDQQLLLRRYVSARGGGLLFLSGQESLDGAVDAKRPLGELSPVYLKESSLEGGEINLRVDLTREGWLQPWLRLRSTQQQEQERLSKMPPFETVNRVGAVKPGASLLMTGTEDADSTLPVLVAQRFGRGRSAALLIGDLWRWGMHRENQQENDLAQGWRQLIRYMVSDVPQRVELKVQQPNDPTKPVRLELVLRNEEYLPDESSNLTLKITSPSGQTFDLSPTADEKHAGAFYADYWGREEGGYVAELVATAEDGTEVGRAAAGWVSQPAAQEFQQLSLNREALAALAQATGGQVIEYPDLPEFVNHWPSDKVPVREIWEYPLWHRPWVLLVAITCLCGEWGLRRWKGLP